MRRLIYISVSLVAFTAMLLTGLTYIYTVPIGGSLLPASTAFAKLALYDRSDAPLSVTYKNSLNYNDYVPLHSIPELLQRAFLVSEDRRFYQHGGMDWPARMSALYQNVINLRPVRGASTITEQVARIINPRPRTLWSRWLEGWEANSVESRFTKSEILEFYLNQVPYAGRKRGVLQGARYYFDRHLSTLNLKEVLALATLVRAPSRLDPFKDSSALNSRVRLLCNQLVNDGAVSSEQCDQVDQQTLELRRAELVTDATHFVSYLNSRPTSDFQTNNGKVTTTLDGALQRRLQSLLDGYLKRLKSNNVGDGALIVLNHQTNEVLAWVNGGRADINEVGSFIDAVVTARQPGSALKPFLYALALEKGWTAATLIDDAPLIQAVGVGAHSYRNYSRTFYGPVRLRDALGNSLNTPAVRTATFVGVNNLLNFLRDVGFKSLDKPWQFYGEGLALGNGEVTLLELVHAYSLIARGGESAELRFTLVPSGVMPNNTAPRRVVSRESSALIADILSDPNARRLEFSRAGLLGFGQQVAVKTGTSSDFKDLWAVGFSNQFTVGVWMGNLNREPTFNVTSSSGPGLVLRAIFKELDSYTVPAPLMRSSNLKRVRICSVSGKLAGERCPFIDELFTDSSTPKETCEHTASETGPIQEARSSIDNPLRIRFPTPGLQVALDPRVPDEMEAITFKLHDEPVFSQVVWVLDGQELKNEKSRAALTWQLQRGKHSLLVRAVSSASNQEMQSAPVNFVVN